MLITKRRQSSIVDVYTERKADCRSDHFLVVTVLKEKIETKTNKFKNNKRWGRERLEKEEIRRYRTAIQKNDLQDGKTIKNIEDLWKDVKTTIIKSAEEVLTTELRKPSKKWYDEECKQVIKQKKEARDKWLENSIWENEEQYKEKRKIAEKICRKKKRSWWENRISNIERHNKTNNTKQFYKKYNKKEEKRIKSLKQEQEDKNIN